MAVTAREQEMLDLADQGMRPGEIAMLLDVRPATVSCVLSQLNGSPAADVRREEAVREGSRRLLAAQRKAGLPA